MSGSRIASNSYAAPKLLAFVSLTPVRYVKGKCENVQQARIREETLGVVKNVSMI